MNIPPPLELERRTAGRQSVGLFNPRPTHSELQTASPNLCPYLKLLLRLQMGPTGFTPCTSPIKRPCF